MGWLKVISKGWWTKRKLIVGLLVLMTLGVALRLTSPTWEGEEPIEEPLESGGET